MSLPMVALGDVATFVRGVTFKPDDVVDLNDPDAVACFRTKNVQDEIDLRDVWGIPRRLMKRDDKLLTEGDLLVSTANSWNLVGKCSWVPALPWSATLGGFISALRPNRDVLDPRYLFWWFSSPKVQAAVRNCARQTTNIANLNLERCAALELPALALPKQRRIAGILDQADTLRRLRRQSLSRLSDLGQAIFYEMFGDPAINPKRFEMRPLRDAAMKFSDGPFGSNLKSDHYVEEGVRVVRLQNIGVGEFIDDDRAYITTAHFESLRKHECLPGDILVGTLGEPNLRACIQPEWLEQALNKADCVQIRVNPEVANAEYICALLNIPSVEKMAHCLVQGQTRARISMGRLRELHVPIAPKLQQDQFAEVIAKLKHEVQSGEDAEKQANSLFASLQHRAFRGEL